jgi:hypothetical protein
MFNHAERILQLSIIFSCFLILISQRTIPSTAQVECYNQPPIRGNLYPSVYDRLKANSWLPGTSAISKRQISVVVYDSSSNEYTKMNEGVLAWNDFTDCAYVNFNTASQSTSPSGAPGANVLWIIRGSNTQVFPSLDNDFQMIGAAVRIQTPYNVGDLNTRPCET